MKYKELAKKLTQMHIEADPYGKSPVYVEVDFNQEKINKVVNCFINPVFERSREEGVSSIYLSGSMMFDHWNKQKELQKNYEIWLKTEKNNKKRKTNTYDTSPLDQKNNEDDE
jgi:hypothetical protein